MNCPFLVVKYKHSHSYLVFNLAHVFFFIKFLTSQQSITDPQYSSARISLADMDQNNLKFFVGFAAFRSVNIILYSSLFSS